MPYPVRISGTEVVMELVGAGRTAAPRLRGAAAFARARFARGDLSACNLLPQEGRVVVDPPHIVDLAANPLAPTSCTATW